MRRTCKAVEAVSRMLDYLGSMGFWWATVSAGDYGETSQLHEVEAGFRELVLGDAGGLLVAAGRCGCPSSAP